MQEIEQQKIYRLPLSSTPFVGREDELVELADLLQNPACRLLTLFGPGGIGKTRLAAELAARQSTFFLGGVYFVELDALEISDLIVCAIAETVEHPCHETVDAKRQLFHYLRSQNLLLILDNFEHLLDGAGLVSEILAAAPGVKIIVTSREVLNLQEEWLWPVSGMRYPSAEDLTTIDLRPEDYGAVQVFIQNAQRIRGDFSFDLERVGVLQICSLVEGMPLALELAAAWVRSLSCEEIAYEITRNLDFLKTRARNVAPRHQSMRAVLDHSWELLSEREQDIFRQLSVFRGGFTREAAAVVTDASLAELSALMDKSLLRWNSSDRYSLHELVRQYAEKQLKDQPDELYATRGRHTAYYMSFLQQQWSHLLGSRPKQALETIEMEIDNIRTAWGWAVIQGMKTEINNGLDSLWFFYDTRGRYREGEKVLDLAVESLEIEQPEINGSLLLGRLMARLGVLCNSIHHCDQAQSLLETALAIFRRLNDRAEMAFALVRLSEVVVYQDSIDCARQLLEESLALYEEIGDLWGQAFVLHWLGNLTTDPPTRSQYAQRALAFYQQIDSRWGTAILTPSVGFSSVLLGNHQDAMRLGQDGLVRCQEIGIRWGAAMSLQVMGLAAYALEDYQTSLRYFIQSIEQSFELRLDRFLDYSTYFTARLLDTLGRTEQASAFYAIAYRYSMEQSVPPYFIDFEEQLPPDRLALVRERSKSIDPEIELEHLLAELHSVEETTWTEQAAVAVPQPLISPLTERELEILERVSAGMSNKDIAGELILSTGTIKWYLSQIYSKLGVDSRTQAVARARELAILH
jgi:predicted ATPase/DNA-binding CsgD family transcriptional regulator